jgi:putative heme-binding domain-containing protein
MRRLGIAPILLLSVTINARAADGPPRVVAAWAAGPLEARVTFDRPVDPALVPAVVGRRIVFGDDVKAGDRHVARNPGDPPAGGKAETRGSLNIAAARLDDGGRTLVLATDPHSRDATYALTLPMADVAYNLRGVEAAWDSGKPDAKPEWTGWWPSLDLAAVSQRLGGSGALETMQARLKTPGRLTLKTLAALPKGSARVMARGSVPIEAGLGNESAKSSPLGVDNRVDVAAEVGDYPLDLTLTATLDGKAPLVLAAGYYGPRDSRSSPIPPAKLTLPWAPPLPASLPLSPVPPELLTGGDPAKGEAVFKGEQAKCANCHKVRGIGGEVGPDLSDLVHRDRSWAYRNINEPSAVIHPDYVPYTVLTKDGRVLAGIVRAEGADAIKVVDTEAKATVIPKLDIEELKPSATSIMPVGLLGAVGEAGVKDLLAFLTGK